MTVARKRIFGGGTCLLCLHFLLFCARSPLSAVGSGPWGGGGGGGGGLELYCIVIITLYHGCHSLTNQ